MASIPLSDLFIKCPELENIYKDINKDDQIELIYFWDEGRESHLGTGWSCNYTIIGIMIFSFAVNSFFKSYFESAGKYTWEKTIEFFKKFNNKYKREKEFYFITTPINGIKITLIIDNSVLNNRDKIYKTYDLYGKLIMLAMRNDEFISDYCKQSIFLKWDYRCNDFMFYLDYIDINSRSRLAPYDRNAEPLIFYGLPNDNITSLNNLYLLRGVFHRSLQEYNEAIDFFIKAIKQDERNADLWMELGTTYYLKHDLQKAIQSWENCIKFSTLNKKTNVGTAYFNIACAESVLGDMEKSADMAINALNEGINIHIILSDPDLEGLRNDRLFKNNKKFFDKSK